MPVAVLLIGAGGLALVAPVQWRRGRWVESGRWIARSVSPHVAAAIPPIGLLVASLGVSILWPPAVVVAFGAAIVCVVAMISSARGQGAVRLGSGIRRLGSEARAMVASRFEAASRPRRYGHSAGHHSSRR